MKLEPKKYYFKTLKQKKVVFMKKYHFKAVFEKKQARTYTEYYKTGSSGNFFMG